MYQSAIASQFDLLSLHCLNPARYPHLLQSAAVGGPGRYDILFAFPGETLSLTDTGGADFLQALDRRWAQAARGMAPVDGLPFQGGWFLYLGYELAGQIEPSVVQHRSESELPVASATRIPAAVIRDHLQQRCWIVSERREYLQAVETDIQRLPLDPPEPAELPLAEPVEEEAQRYLDAVKQVLRYIRDGDVFQVNLSRLWHGEWPVGVSAADLYRRLRAANPGPFNGLVTWGETAIVSSSPERLVAVRGDRVQTRPIAGTRGRGAQAESDQRKSAELLHHPKELAEHIMLIDLERNDLGRIAQPGSVRVNELMTLESYATVHHIVSNVEATLRPDISPGQVIRAVFPGGTITGCPKVRCMQIIAELEPLARGAYTGSIGYLNHDGSMDLNILIRTMVKDRDQLSFRAGAGIVYDSEPRRELEETRDKAAGLLRALRGGS